MTERFSPHRLRVRMAECELGVADVAARLRMTPAAVATWRRGAGTPTVRRLAQLANVLHCRVCDLFEEAPHARRRR